MTGAPDRPADPVELLVAPRSRAVGAGTVDRLLPHRLRRLVGPFVYLDLIGPEPLPAGTGIDVPVHPHIGLATVTFLLQGALVHRDSTGAIQRIDPGDVNWMHAGGGVSHSERSPEDERAADSTIEGMQLWVALPDDHEDDQASFEHHPGGSLPSGPAGDAEVRVLAGEAFGLRSPVGAASRLHLVVATLGPAGGVLPAAEATDRSVLVVTGDVEVGDGTSWSPVPERHLAVLDDATSEIRSHGAATVVLLGGEPVGARHIWWNFVASSQERIDRARRRWEDGGFAPVPGESERVPAPGAPDDPAGG